MRPRRFRSLAFLGLCCGLFCVVDLILARSQEPPTARPTPPKQQAEEARKPPGPEDRPVDRAAREREIEAALDRMFEEYDLKPHPPDPIPDDPPPHEGAMIALPPYIIEPPDLIVVEVLEALPGRPISGERLVRPDGKISLGFYGEVDVAGLTIEQAKVKIIKQLRRYLEDETLGLVEHDRSWMEHAEGPFPPDAGLPKPAIPEPPADAKPFQFDERKKEKPAEKPRTTRASRRLAPARSQSHRVPAGRAIRVIARTQEQEEKKPEAGKEPVKIPLEAGGKVTITIELQAEDKQTQQLEAAGAADDFPGPWKGPVAPQDTNRIFVDVSAYNSKNFYVMGDVTAPGRLPVTGKETVLDALHFAGGLLPTAEPKDIRLVRPARGGKPEHVYKVDLEAIMQRGDTRTNYQIFPDDRLVIGRNEVVKTTVELDREVAPLQTILSAIRQEANVLRDLKNADAGKADAILKDLVEFWIQEMKRPEGARFDEQTLREALIRRLQVKPAEPGAR
jgi:protein involved in polysaccharide export with SLBB domain